MKTLPHLPLLLLLIAGSLPLFSQPVVFTNQSDLLQSTPGFGFAPDCVVDMNGDFLDDVVRVGLKGFYIDYLQPDGSFKHRFINMVTQVPPSWSICAGDLDKNGFNDLFFGGSYTVSFVKANETGTAYTEDVMPGYIFSQRNTLADIDNDGWLDAFVCHDDDQSIPFRNDGAGNMARDTSLIHTADRPGNYAAIWTDYDNDRDIDLYLSKCVQFAPPGDINRTNLLYRNNGDGTFTEVGAQAGLDDNAQSWATVFEDFDNDGDFDAFIVNHDFQNRLFRNNGDGTFTDVIAGSGINPTDLNAFENAAGDFNNDGFMDIFADLEQRLYLGHGDLTFTGQSAPVEPGAIGDLNSDGFLDVMWDRELWLNEANDNHWVKVNPLGIAGNRNGIGARVEVYGSWGLQVREVRSGQSYQPMSSLNVHFGLGPADHVDSLIIRWPSGVVTRRFNLTADSTYFVPEASCLLPATTLTVGGPTQICSGDTVQLTAPVGFGQYAWPNGDTMSALRVGQGGYYYALLTDSEGCVSLSNAVSITLIEEASPRIHAAESRRFCAGDTLVLHASPGTNYVWSNGASGASSIAVTEPGSYTVSLDALCMPGQLISPPFDVIVHPTPLLPVASGVTGTVGDSLLLTATGDHIHWYDQPVGGMLLDTGATFQTPVLDTSTTFYAESRYVYPGAVQFGGKPDSSGTGGLGYTGYLLFENWEPFTLRSVTVYVPVGAPTATRIIRLFSGDSLLASKVLPVVTGKNELILNFDVPVGQHSLHAPQGTLFRNLGPQDYPFPLGDAGQILTSSYGDDRYYFFYNWKIETAGLECASERVPVEVTLTTGTAEAGERAGWRVFPNPASGRVFVEAAGSGLGFVRVVDVTGREVIRTSLTDRRPDALDISGLAAGIYSVQLWREGRMNCVKLVVQ